MSHTQPSGHTFQSAHPSESDAARFAPNDVRALKSFLAARTPPMTPSKDEQLVASLPVKDSEAAPWNSRVRNLSGPNSKQAGGGSLPYVSTLHKKSPSKSASTKRYSMSQSPGLMGTTALSSSKGSSRFLLTVVPPMHLPHDPPHPRTNPQCTGYGPPEHFKRGILIPLYPTLAGQLAAISREYGLPSTGGLVLYLLSAVDPTSSTHATLPGSQMLAGEGGPRISEEAWAMLWNQLFENDDEEVLIMAENESTHDEDEHDAPPVPPVPAAFERTPRAHHDEGLASASDLEDADNASKSSEVQSVEGPWADANAPQYATDPARRLIGRGFPPKTQYGLISPVSRASSASHHAKIASNSARARHPSGRSVGSISGSRHPSRSRNVSGSSEALGSPSLNSSFGSALIVGKVEFDIDRTRGGKSRWYDNWLEGASIPATQHPSPMLYVPEAPKFAEEHAASPQELYLPNMVSKREAAQPDAHEHVEPSRDDEVPQPAELRALSNPPTSERASLGSVSVFSSRRESMVAHDRAISPAAASLHSEHERLLDDEPELAEEDGFVALPDEDEHESARSSPRVTASDPLAEVFGDDRQTWQQFGAETVSHSSHEESEPVRDMENERQVVEVTAMDPASMPNELGVANVESFAPPSNDELGLPPPQDDVADIRSLLRSPEPHNVNLASPIHLASSPNLEQAAFEPVDKLEPLETTSAPTNVELATSELQALAHSRMASFDETDSPPSAISARAARPERRGIIDWSAIQTSPVPEPLSPVESTKSEQATGAVPPVQEKQDSRQSTLGLADNLDDLERALAELTPNMARSPTMQLGRSAEESMTSSPLQAMSQPSESVSPSPAAPAPLFASPSASPFDHKAVSPLLSSRRPFVYTSRSPQMAPPASPKTSAVDDEAAPSLTRDVEGYGRNSPQEANAPSSPVAPTFTKPLPAVEQPVAAVTMTTTTTSSADEATSLSPAVVASSAFTPPPRKSSSTRKPRSASISQQDAERPTSVEVPPVPARVLAQQDAYEGLRDSSELATTGLGIEGIAEPVDLDAALPPPPPPPAKEPLKKDIVNDAAAEPVTLGSKSPRSPALAQSSSSTKAPVLLKSLRAGRAWHENSPAAAPVKTQGSPVLPTVDTAIASSQAREGGSTKNSPMNAFFNKSAFKLFQKKGSEATEDKLPLSPVTAPAVETAAQSVVVPATMTSPAIEPTSPAMMTEDASKREFLEAPRMQAGASSDSALSDEADLPPTPATPGPRSASVSPQVYKTPQIPPLPFDGAEREVTNFSDLAPYRTSPLAASSPRSDYDGAPRTPYKSYGANGSSSFVGKNGYPASAPTTPAAWSSRPPRNDSKRFAPQRSKHRLSADIDNLLSQMTDLDFAAESGDEDRDDDGTIAEFEEMKRQVEEDARGAPSPLAAAFDIKPLPLGDDLAALVGKSMLESSTLSPPTSPNE